jgi:hypothetical protein
MTQKVIDPSSNLKNLTDDELSRLFHICKTNADLFLKLMPGHPWLELVKKNPTQALQGLVLVHQMK